MASREIGEQKTLARRCESPINGQHKRNSRPAIIFVASQTDVFLGIASLVSVLKQRGHAVDVMPLEYSALSQRISRAAGPVLLGISLSIRYVPQALALLKKLKKRHRFISILGGAQPSAAPEIIEEDGVDAVCLGEGEGAIVELAEALAENRSYERVQNLWVKTESGTICKNRVRPPIADLDGLPFPDRELWAKSPFFNPNPMPMMASRGCMFACRYCQQSYYNNVLYAEYPTRVRRRSVENVIQEIKEYRQRVRLRYVRFEDSVFISSLEWTKEFCQAYQKHIGLPFACNIRPELLTRDCATWLARAGCRWISMGIETAHPRLREKILGRRMTTEQIISAARIIRSSGMRLRATNIIGMQREGLDRDRQTLLLNQRCGVELAQAFPLSILPATDLARCNKKRSVRRPFFQRLRVRNLRALFGIAVEWPALEPLLRVAVLLPLTFLYDIIWLLWEVYCQNVRLWPITPGDVERKCVRFMRRCTEWRGIR